MNQDLIIKLIEMLVRTESNTDTVSVRKERPIVAFANNCIIFGYSDGSKIGEITINKARYCYHYTKPAKAEAKGFMALAKYGPAEGSKVSGPVDNVTVDACCIIEATQEAVNVWESSQWK